MKERQVTELYECLRIHTDLTDRHRTFLTSFSAGSKQCHGVVSDGDRTDTEVISGNSVPA